MPSDEQFPGWNWEDPEALASLMDDFTADLAHCETLEQIADKLPTTRAELVTYGITGIEFAAFRTAHPEGLGTDLVAVHTDERAAEPGSLYRVNEISYFTPLDIRNPLPFEDNAVDWVYAEHLIEHITLPVALGWLTEVNRILTPGGVLRLTTPDLQKYVAGYSDKNTFYEEHRTRLSDMQVGPPMPARKAFMFNQIFYLYGHRWLYDEPELRYALTKAGFTPATIQLTTFQEGTRQDVANLDMSFRTDETMYVEATA
jgi:predicted SAM-dependent methyltransferase